MINASDILNASVLIVDDQESNVLLLEKMLRDAGYARIASTMDPHEVCELYRKNRYDLILLDLQMPGMDGFQVMEGLKAIETDSYLPVLVITAQPGHKLRALQAGAKDFISKPFDVIEVKRVFKTCWKCVCCTGNLMITTRCWNRRCRNGPPNWRTRKITWN